MSIDEVMPKDDKVKLIFGCFIDKRDYDSVDEKISSFPPIYTVTTNFTLLRHVDEAKRALKHLARHLVKEKVIDKQYLLRIYEEMYYDESL